MTDQQGGAVAAWRCAVCGTTVDVATPYPFTCPRSTPTDRRHVLHPVVAAGAAVGVLDDPNPFVAYGPWMAWWAFGTSHGMTEAALVDLAGDVGAGFDGDSVQCVRPRFAPWSAGVGVGQGRDRQCRR